MLNNGRYFRARNALGEMLEGTAKPGSSESLVDPLICPRAESMHSAPTPTLPIAGYPSSTIIEYRLSPLLHYVGTTENGEQDAHDPKSSHGGKLHGTHTQRERAPLG